MTQHTHARRSTITQLPDGRWQVYVNYPDGNTTSPTRQVFEKFGDAVRTAIKESGSNDELMFRGGTALRAVYESFDFG